MDIKTFLVGAVFGGLVFAAVDRFLLTDQGIRVTNVEDVEAEPKLGATIESTGRTAEQSSEAQYPNEPGPPEPQELSASTIVDQSVPMLDPLTARNPGQSEQRPPTDIHSQRQRDNKTQDVSYWLEKHRDELEAEPKDDSWAYYMEQSILQFLANHPAMSDFEISYIECRTITCQIQVVGFDESTNPTWQRIMYDLRQQVPNEVYEWGSSAYNDNGRLVLVQTMKRNQSSP
jgi:hypothetical protein